MENKRFMVGILVGYHFGDCSPEEVTFDYECHYFDKYEEASKFAEGYFDTHEEASGFVEGYQKSQTFIIDTGIDTENPF